MNLGFYGHIGAFEAQGKVSRSTADGAGFGARNTEMLKASCNFQNKISMTFSNPTAKIVRSKDK